MSGGLYASGQNSGSIPDLNKEVCKNMGGRYD
jgi:hypothetical protein